MANGADKMAQMPELRKKLAWTILILCMYRVGVHVPVPGIDAGALSHFFASMQGSVFALLDMFSGGGLSNVSVFALGIMPYISASIILQLLQVVSPDIKRMAKEEDPYNFILMPAVSANVSGQIGSVIAGGVVLSIAPVIANML